MQTNNRTGPRQDWGDRRTWLIIAALFFFSIILATLTYVMPKGRVAEQPGIHTY